MIYSKENTHCKQTIQQHKILTTMRYAINKALPTNNLSQIIDEFFNGTSNLKPATPYNGFQGHSSPFANVIENKDAVSIELAIPGVPKENLNIYLEKDLLLIESKAVLKEEPKEEDKAESKQDVKANIESVKVRRKEFNYSTFSRSFRLDTKVFDTQNISSKYDLGILTINIPFRQEEVEEKISIPVL